MANEAAARTKETEYRWTGEIGRLVGELVNWTVISGFVGKSDAARAHRREATWRDVTWRDAVSVSVSVSVAFASIESN